MLKIINKLQIKQKSLSNNKGFTLIELAIVLIIIGLILGAVTKGRDLIRSGEQKKVYTKFLNEWRMAYLNYYDRTGGSLAGTTTANLVTTIEGKGLTAPSTGTGYSYQNATINIDFSTQNGYMTISNVPLELNATIDTIADGVNDPSNGTYTYTPTTGTATTTTTGSWYMEL